MILPTKDQCREWFKTKCWDAYDRYDTDVITLNRMIETFCLEHPGTEEWMKRRDHLKPMTIKKNLSKASALSVSGTKTQAIEHLKSTAKDCLTYIALSNGS
jgi:hypothetical protein